MSVLRQESITIMRYLYKVYDHFARRATLYICFLAATAIFGHFFLLTINLTTSLPGWVFAIEKGVHPKKGELAAFVYEGGGPYPSGAYFLKILTGVPGDLVYAKDMGFGYHDFFVGGKFVGRSKPVSSTGAPLSIGQTGVLPTGNYYMAAPNPDSLDSRYSLVSWVQERQIIGRGIRIF